MDAAIFWNRMTEQERVTFCVSRAHLDTSHAAMISNQPFVLLPVSVKVAIYSCDEWRNSEQ